MTTPRVLTTLLAVITLAGCTAMSQPTNQLAENPDLRVDQVLRTYSGAQANGVSCQAAMQGWRHATDCEGLLREVMQLHAAFPQNERVMMLAATMAYESGRATQAAYLLDQLLAHQRPRPEAAVLRSQIALQEGNLTLARNLLAQQVRLSPRHPQLYEAQAAVRYIDRKYDAAFAALAMADQVGAPSWRTAYHRGLIFEQQKQFDAACHQYEVSLRGKPGYSAPQTRLAALATGTNCDRLRARLGG